MIFFYFIKQREFYKDHIYILISLKFLILILYSTKKIICIFFNFHEKKNGSDNTSF